MTEKEITEFLRKYDGKEVTEITSDELIIFWLRKPERSISIRNISGVFEVKTWLIEPYEWKVIFTKPERMQIETAIVFNLLEQFAEANRRGFDL